jgi:uncharacterized protein YdhG (YjbR/CyaY superfamily)
MTSTRTSTPSTATTTTTTSTAVDEYIAGFPADARSTLQTLRETIRRVVPECDEKISYKMPTITIGGKALLHFGGWKHHVGMYPVPVFDDGESTADDRLENDVAPYRTTKATLRFPLKSAVPFDLVERVVVEMVRRRRRA